MNVTGINSIDLGVILVYILVMVIVGIVFARFMKTTRDLFAAGTNAPWWLSGISSYMTIFSAGTFVIWGSIAYVFGWVGITIQWVITVGLLVSTVFFSHRWKRIGIESPVQFLEERFSFGVRQLIVWVRLPTAIMITAQSLYSISVLTQNQIGVGYSLNTIIVIMTSIVVLYTILGGLWAVFTTDMLQFFVLMLITIMILLLSLKTVGGLWVFIDRAPAGFFHLAQNASDYAEPHRVKFTWSYFLFWTIFKTFEICTFWELIQRYQSCRSEKEAKRSGYLVAGLYAVTPIIWLLPIMIYRVIDPSYYNPADPLATGQAEVIYMVMCRKLLPYGLAGLALAAMLSATGSLVNSSLNVMSAVLTRDFYARLFRKNASDRELLLIGRILIFLLGIVIAFMACNIKNWGGVVNWLFLCRTVFGGPMVVPFLWGIISRRTSAKTVWWAVITGVLVSSIFQFVLPRYGSEITLANKILASIVVPFLVLVIGDMITRQDPVKQEEVNSFFNRMNTPLSISHGISTIDYGPIILIGIFTAFFGVVIMQLLWFVKEQKFFIFSFSIALIIFGVLLAFIKRFAKR